MVGCSYSLELTQPNSPYPGPFPPAFEKLAERNPSLARELAKLPEFEDGLSAEEFVGLERLAGLYEAHPDKFDRAFNAMRMVGNPEVRRHCSPLQALFWLSEQNAANLEPQIMHYNTTTLIAAAWQFYDLHRWKDPTAVIERLNAPGLVQYWFVNNFSYDWSKFYINTPDALPQSAERTIKIKRGICIDAAHLAYTCLTRAGYDATGLNIYFAGRAQGGAIMHSVCVYKTVENDRAVYYKLADTHRRSRIEGPYASMRSAAEAVAHQYGIALGSYHTGLPAYHYNLW
jgi:hypothetical protein